MNYDKPTASSLERAYECPSSCAIQVRVHSSSGYADAGTDKHAFVEAVLAKHKPIAEALADVPLESRQTCADLDWDTLLDGIDRTTIRCEVAYAIDAATGGVRELGQSLGRNYPKTSETEICGTIDIVAVLADGRAIVEDLKTGQPTTPCAENWQMRFAAYAVHIATGALEVVARLSYLDEDGKVRHDEHVFDAFDLADFADELGRILRRIAKAAEEIAAGKLVVNKGDWCKYCPAFASCPAQVAIVRNLVHELTSMDGLSLEHLSPEQVGVAWARFKELAPMVKKIDAALKDYVRAHPNEVVLPDGKIVREIEKGKTSINGERALALAREYGATPEEQASCVRRAEWTELRACLPEGAKKKRAKKSNDSNNGEAA